MSALLESALTAEQRAAADAADAEQARDPHPEVRMQQIKLRRAEIAAALSTQKHIWITTGIESPRGVRSGLEAEDAALALEGLRLGAEAQRFKVYRRLTQNAELLTQILRLLDEKSLWPIALEAAQRSSVELSSITPWKSEQKDEASQ